MVLVFNIRYVVFVIFNYVVQLATMSSITGNGDRDETENCSQNLHSLFRDFDSVNYLFMGLPTLSAVPVYEKKNIKME